MPRIARIVAPGVPHHVTQRGNRRMPTFFTAADYRIYLRLMAASCRACDVQVWAYCLLPNHVHLIAVPSDEDGLRRAIGEAHRGYTVRVNAREGWTGHLWQGRFSSFPLDGPHLVAAARYVELNPVRAGLVSDPCAWPWSSAAAHVRGFDDGLAAVEPLGSIIGDWSEFLRSAPDEDEAAGLRQHERTGRPMGDERFIEKLEQSLERPLLPRRAGRKPKPDGAGEPASHDTH